MWRRSSSSVSTAVSNYYSSYERSKKRIISSSWICLSFSLYTTELPPPIRVSVTESAGRGVFATRKIQAGQLIHSAKPIISHPSITTTNTVCYLCLKSFNNIIINNNDINSISPPLGTAVFCSPLCEHQSKGFYDIEKLADWSAHTQHCHAQGLKYPFLAKRLACMVVSGVASAEALDILQPAILSREMISQMEKEFTLLRRALEEADIPVEKISCILYNTQFNYCCCNHFFYCKVTEMDNHFSLTLLVLTKQWYIGVLARIRINSFRIELVGRSYEDLLSLAAASVEAEAAVGNALYMLPSFYNHDCDPNTHIVWIESVDARLKALRDIDEGEELRICYIDASMEYDARQTILVKGFGFKCDCFRCQSGD